MDMLDLDHSDTLALISMGIAIACLLTALVYVLVLHWSFMSQTRKHEQALIAIIKARTLSEYASAKQQLETSPQDRQREIELENDLAREARRLSEYEGPRPI